MGPHGSEKMNKSQATSSDGSESEGRESAVMTERLRNCTASCVASSLFGVRTSKDAVHRCTEAASCSQAARGKLGKRCASLLESHGRASRADKATNMESLAPTGKSQEFKRMEICKRGETARNKQVCSFLSPHCTFLVCRRCWIRHESDHASEVLLPPHTGSPFQSAPST